MFWRDSLLARVQFPHEFEQQADLEIQPLEFGGISEGNRVVAGVTGVDIQCKQGMEMGEIRPLQIPEFDLIGQG